MSEEALSVQGGGEGVGEAGSCSLTPAPHAVVVGPADTPDCPWRNRSEFFQGREAIKVRERGKDGGRP